MDQEKKNLKVFGYGLAIILSLILFKLWRTNTLGGLQALLVLAIATLVFLATFWYNLLLSFYRPWMKAAHFIGNIVTVLLLSFVFYGIFGPIGIFLRLFKIDLLERRIDPGSGSYWMKRKAKPYDRLRDTKQF